MCIPRGRCSHTSRIYPRCAALRPPRWRAAALQASLHLGGGAQPLYPKDVAPPSSSEWADGEDGRAGGNRKEDVCIFV